MVYERKMNIERWWKGEDGRRRSNRRNPCPRITSPSTNPMQTGQRSKPGFYGKRNEGLLNDINI
jgi:hypothetical protein